MIHIENLLNQLKWYFPIAVFLVAIFFMIEKLILHKRQKGIHYFWLLCFFLYLSMLYEIVIGITDSYAFYHATRHRPNFIPFVSLIKVYDMGIKRMIQQVFLNIVLMIPFGFLLPVTFSWFRSFAKTGFIILIVSATIEFVQYFIGRSADIDDVIMNLTGGVVGYFCFKLYEKIV